jgi:hypothetical protein
MLKPGSLLVIITWPTKSKCLILTSHKASPPQPNETIAEYVDLYSALLYNTKLPRMSTLQPLLRRRWSRGGGFSGVPRLWWVSRRGLAANPHSVACEGRVLLRFVFALWSMLMTMWSNQIITLLCYYLSIVWWCPVM